MINIVSHSDEPFKGRKEAGSLLAEALKGLGGAGTVVLGIPRGGVVVAKELNRILNARLDIVLSHKLGAPRNPELAVGAISESGKVFLDGRITSLTGSDEAYIKAEAKRQGLEIKRRAEIFRKILPKADLKGKTGIITDDGVATGATMQAALWAARQEKPKRLIAACPVASSEAVERIEGYCDEVIVYRLPDFFGAVGQFYKDFGQTTDEEVMAILKAEASTRRFPK